MMVAVYAAAHEIGHLILGADAHVPSGLMKKSWDRQDMEAMFQNRVHFSRDQAARIVDCCRSTTRKIVLKRQRHELDIEPLRSIVMMAG